MSFGVTLLRARGSGDVIGEEIRLPLDLFVHGAHGDRAGHLSRRVAAHAVGDDEESELLVDEEVVLVVVAHLAHVRRGVEADRFAQLHSVDR